MGEQGTRGEMTFEEALGQLEMVVESLERGDLALDDALGAFQEGINLLRICIKKLNAFEEQVEVLMADYYSEIPSWLCQDAGGKNK